MTDDQLTWGELKKFMEDENVSDDANINLQVRLEGIIPSLTVSGWANSIERPSVYTITLRHNSRS